MNPQCTWTTGLFVTYMMLQLVTIVLKSMFMNLCQPCWKRQFKSIYDQSDQRLTLLFFYCIVVYCTLLFVTVLYLLRWTHYLAFDCFYIRLQLCDGKIQLMD